MSDAPVATNAAEANRMLKMVWKDRNSLYLGREIFKYIVLAQSVVIIAMLLF